MRHHLPGPPLKSSSAQLACVLGTLKGGVRESGKVLLRNLGCVWVTRERPLVCMFSDQGVEPSPKFAVAKGQEGTRKAR